MSRTPRPHGGGSTDQSEPYRTLTISMARYETFCRRKALASHPDVTQGPLPSFLARLASLPTPEAFHV